MIQSQSKGDPPLDKGGGGAEVAGKESDPLRRFNGPTPQRGGPIDSRIHRHDSRDYGSVPSAKDWKRPSRGHDVYRRDDRGLKDRWRERKRWDRPKRDALREPRRENTRESLREGSLDNLTGELPRDYRDPARSSRPLTEIPRARMTYDDDFREARTSSAKKEQFTPVAKKEQPIDSKPANHSSDTITGTPSEIKTSRRFTRRPGDKFRDLMMGTERKSQSGNHSEAKADHTPGKSPPQEAYRKSVSPFTVDSSAEDAHLGSPSATEGAPKIPPQAPEGSINALRDHSDTSLTQNPEHNEDSAKSPPLPETASQSMDTEVASQSMATEQKPDQNKDDGLGKLEHSGVVEAEPLPAASLADVQTVLDGTEPQEVMRDESRHAGLKESANDINIPPTTSAKLERAPEPATDLPPQEIVFNEKLLREYEALIRKVPPKLNYVSRSWTTSSPDPKVVQSCALRGAALKANIEARRKLYNEQRVAWLKTLEVLEKEARMDPLSSLSTNAPTSTKSTQATVNSTSRKRSRDDDVAPSSSNRRARDRHSRAHGDVARSEAEFLEILASLEAQTARDPLVRARLTSASIPDQSQTPFETRFVTTNSLLVDHSSLLQRLSTDAVDDFTAEQHELFIDAYCRWPKEFGKIAHFVGRSFNDCVLHYYRTKKSADYKRLLLQKSKKKRGRKPRKRTDVDSLPTTPATPATPVTPILATGFELPSASAPTPLTPDGPTHLVERGDLELASAPSLEPKQAPDQLVEPQESVEQLDHKNPPTDSGPPLGSATAETSSLLPPPVLPFQPTDETSLPKEHDFSDGDTATFESLLKIYGPALTTIAEHMNKPFLAIQELHQRHETAIRAQDSALGPVKQPPKPTSSVKKPAVTKLRGPEAMQGPPSGLFAPRKALLPATVIQDTPQIIPPVVQPPQQQILTLPQQPSASESAHGYAVDTQRPKVTVVAQAPSKRSKAKARASVRDKALEPTKPDEAPASKHLLSNRAQDCLRQQLSFIPPVLPNLKKFEFSSKQSIHNLSLAHEFTGFHESYERHS